MLFYCLLVFPALDHTFPPPAPSFEPCFRGCWFSLLYCFSHPSASRPSSESCFGGCWLLQFDYFVGSERSIAPSRLPPRPPELAFGGAVLCCFVAFVGSARSIAPFRVPPPPPNLVFGGAGFCCVIICLGSERSIAPFCLPPLLRILLSGVMVFAVLLSFWVPSARSHLTPPARSSGSCFRGPPRSNRRTDVTHF